MVPRQGITDVSLFARPLPMQRVFGARLDVSPKCYAISHLNISFQGWWELMKRSPNLPWWAVHARSPNLSWWAVHARSPNLSWWAVHARSPDEKVWLCVSSNESRVLNWIL